MGSLVYYSSESGNTDNFINKLGLAAEKIPISPKNSELVMKEPYVLILPTYADGAGRGALAKGVVRFFKNDVNKGLIRGVIGSGNTNFGRYYCFAAVKLAEKLNIPLLYKFELLGTQEDVVLVRNILKDFWREQDEFY